MDTSRIDPRLRRNRLKEILFEASRVHPELRRALLERACGDDRWMLVEVESLLGYVGRVPHDIEEEGEPTPGPVIGLQTRTALPTEPRSGAAREAGKSSEDSSGPATAPGMRAWAATRSRRP